jgi:tetratricopeptide (TPR) repeat protein
MNANNAAAYNNRGFAWRKLGRYAEAIEDYTKSLELSPNNLKTLNNRGFSYAKSGNFAKAISDYNKVQQVWQFCSPRFNR